MSTSQSEHDEYYGFIQDVIFMFGNKHSPHYVETSYGSKFDTHAFCNEYAKKLRALLAQSHQSAEAALLEKLQPLLEGKDSNLYDASGKPYGYDEEIEAENNLKAEIRTALNPPKEEDTFSASVAEVRRVREANEAFYKEHGHYWYEDCDNYSIECHAPKEEDV